MPTLANADGSQIIQAHSLSRTIGRAMALSSAAFGLLYLLGIVVNLATSGSFYPSGDDVKAVSAVIALLWNQVLVILCLDFYRGGRAAPLERTPCRDVPTQAETDACVTRTHATHQQPDGAAQPCSLDSRAWRRGSPPYVGQPASSCRALSHDWLLRGGLLARVGAPSPRRGVRSCPHAHTRRPPCQFSPQSVSPRC